MDQRQIVSGPTTGLLQLQFVPKTWNFPKLGEAYQSAFTKAIQAYNQQRKMNKGEMEEETYLHSLVGQLDEIEHFIYLWFTQASLPPEEQKAMFALLDQVQIAHKELIKRMIELDARPWVAGKRESKELDALYELWRNMTQRGGDGAFRISNILLPEQAARGATLSRNARQDLQDALFAALARLISRPQGQLLLETIHLEGLKGKVVKCAVSIMAYWSGMTGPLASNLDTTALFRYDKNTGSITRGQGSGGAIESTFIGLKDSDMMDYNDQKKLILSPVFIGLGHELVHVAHYQRGSYVGRTIASGLPEGYDGNLEEFLTIPNIQDQLQLGEQAMKMEVMNTDSNEFEPRVFKLQDLILMNIGIPTEAELRAEHSLDARYGHGSRPNPILYPAYDEKKHSPGDVITGPKDWAFQVKLPKV